MPAQPIPAGFHTITPYLITTNAAELIEFLQKAFGAEIKNIHKQPDGVVMHAALRIGDSMLMMTDARPPWTPLPGAYYLYVPDVDARYARAIKAGAESMSAPANQFYGDRMAGIKDPSGNTWWMATHIEDVSEEEIERRRRTMPHVRGK